MKMSEKQTMSITRALAELKRLDDRIERESTSATYVAVSVGKNEQKKVNGINSTVDEVSKKIRSSYDSVIDLFTRRGAIKSAIVLSNAKTFVTVSGKQLTVAEAIELKQSINLKRTLVAQMQSQLTTARSVMNQLNAKLEIKIDGFLTTLYGSEKSKADAASVESVGKVQRDASEASLIDVLDLSTKIEKLIEEISVVDTELDFTLSEINAKTEIVV